MTKRLLLVLAEFLELLAGTEKPVDVGAVGPDEPYSAREAKAIGPAIAKFATDRLIRTAGARPSVRRTRHGAVVWQWLPIRREACRQKAQELRQKAALLPEDDSVAATNPRQLVLF